jgi:hypothetical protein
VITRTRLSYVIRTLPALFIVFLKTFGQVSSQYFDPTTNALYEIHLHKSSYHWVPNSDSFLQHAIKILVFLLYFSYFLVISINDSYCISSILCTISVSAPLF